MKGVDDRCVRELCMRGVYGRTERGVHESCR